MDPSKMLVMLRDPFGRTKLFPKCPEDEVLQNLYDETIETLTKAFEFANSGDFKKGRALVVESQKNHTAVRKSNPAFAQSVFLNSLGISTIKLGRNLGLFDMLSMDIGCLSKEKHGADYLKNGSWEEAAYDINPDGTEEPVYYNADTEEWCIERDDHYMVAVSCDPCDPCMPSM